jgi:hypothetical protein
MEELSLRGVITTKQSLDIALLPACWQAGSKAMTIFGNVKSLKSFSPERGIYV